MCNVALLGTRLVLGSYLAAALVTRMLTAPPPAPANPAGQEESAGQSSTQAAAPR